MRVRESAGLTDPGRVRRRNEDSFVCEPPLFAVADGMGGAQAGEIASRIAAAAFKEARGAGDLDGEARLRSIIQEANRRIYARAAGDPTVSGMGTTVTAALVDGERVAVGHVGDSRAYLLRDGELEQVTDDHSLVADLVRSGRLSPEEAELHPQRSVITRALGTDPAVEVDSFSVEARPGDLFLLCSDGLTTMLDDATVVQTLTSTMRLADAARALVATANREGGEDNITVVLFALEEGDPSEPADDDTLSGLEVPAITLTEAAPLPAATTNGQPEQSAPGAAVSGPRPRSARRAAIVIALVLVLFAGLAALALWGLSRAHFVGADEQGRVVVYQGVPWNLFGDSVKLYRETYVSRLLATQLTPAEREQLFDHSLIGEGAARAEIARYEQEATPGTPRP
jgi:PPM family protein phosphatase